jgi:hypothetical protein
VGFSQLVSGRVAAQTKENLEDVSRTHQRRACIRAFSTEVPDKYTVVIQINWLHYISTELLIQQQRVLYQLDSHSPLKKKTGHRYSRHAR